MLYLLGGTVVMCRIQARQYKALSKSGVFFVSTSIGSAAFVVSSGFSVLISTFGFSFFFFLFLFLFLFLFFFFLFDVSDGLGDFEVAGVVVAAGVGLGVGVEGAAALLLFESALDPFVLISGVFPMID